MNVWGDECLKIGRGWWMSEVMNVGVMNVGQSFLSCQASISYRVPEKLGSRWSNISFLAEESGQAWDVHLRIPARSWSSQPDDHWGLAHLRGGLGHHHCCIRCCARSSQKPGRKDPQLPQFQCKRIDSSRIGNRIPVSISCSWPNPRIHCLFNHTEAFCLIDKTNLLSGGVGIKQIQSSHLICWSKATLIWMWGLAFGQQKSQVLSIINYF